MSSGRSFFSFGLPRRPRIIGYFRSIRGHVPSRSLALVSRALHAGFCRRYDSDLLDTIAEGLDDPVRHPAAGVMLTSVRAQLNALRAALAPPAPLHLAETEAHAFARGRV